MHVINYKLPLAERVAESAFFHAKCAADFNKIGNKQLKLAHEKCVVKAAEYLENVLKHAAEV